MEVGRRGDEKHEKRRGRKRGREDPIGRLHDVLCGEGKKDWEERTHEKKPAFWSVHTRRRRTREHVGALIL